MYISNMNAYVKNYKRHKKTRPKKKIYIFKTIAQKPGKYQGNFLRFENVGLS